MDNFAVCHDGGEVEFVGVGRCFEIGAGEGVPDFRVRRFEEREFFVDPLAAETPGDAGEFDGEEGGGALLQVIGLPEGILDDRWGGALG